jgi:hypothetical protein
MKRLMVAAAAVAALAGATASAALANHSWGGYHWARTSNPFTVKLGDNVNGAWDNMLRTASSDWSAGSFGSPLRTTIVAGGTRPKPCKATAGRVEVCNASYGNTGWLGVATVWLQSGTTHIVQGTVKNNDYYFGSSTYQYNNSAEMQHVICQEVGHTFGLDHQSETGASLNTCMDYYHNTSASDTKSTHPNQHDYEELATIYQHLDSTTTLGATSKLVPTGAVGESTFVTRRSNGVTVVTHVLWANAFHATF